jgi:hypothetical protein
LGKLKIVFQGTKMKKILWGTFLSVEFFNALACAVPEDKEKVNRLSQSFEDLKKILK